jgi:Xaa-Pro aminopeptidase
MPRSGDTFFPFRQNSDMFYLTGIDQEGCALLMFPDHPNPGYRELLFIPETSKYIEIWEGPKLSQEQASSISGIQNIFWKNEFDKIIKKLISKTQTIYTWKNTNSRFSSEIQDKNHLFTSYLKKEFPGYKYEELGHILSYLRLIKEPEEIEQIKKGCAITKSAFLNILPKVRPGIPEYAIEAEITHEFAKNGTKHAYEPIIASGSNACILHYIKNNKIMEPGELVLMDFGSEYANYASDCSRTIPVNGAYTARQKTLYNITLEIFYKAKELLKPGISINIFHKSIVKLWQEAHIKLGLYTKKAVEKDSSLTKKYFPHGTSHYMGLDVHEEGNRDIPLVPGMVLTCEPGIYLPEEQTGIRLENDIQITESGNEDLMKEIPIEINDIENLM